MGEELARELGRAATPAEIAKRTGATLEQVLEAREAAGRLPRGQSSTAHATTTRSGDGLGASFGIEDPGFGNAEDAATIERLMRVLNEREREVLRLRFAEDLTQAEIGDARRRVADARQPHHPPGDQPLARRCRPVEARGPEAADAVLYAPAMEHWDLRTLDVAPHQPRILHSARGEARSILINLPAGEELQEHQVHERAYVVVIDGEVELAGTSGAAASRRCSTRNERHAVQATTDSRLLLVLAPVAGRRPPGRTRLMAEITFQNVWKRYPGRLRGRQGHEPRDRATASS